MTRTSEIAERLERATAGEWLVWSNEHRAWWRPKAAGYTNHIEAAGRYTFESALSHCNTRDRQENGTPSEMPVPAPESYPSLNAPADLAYLLAENAKLRTRIGVAIDLLTERTHGSSARSPAHNARLLLEGALTARGEEK